MSKIPPNPQQPSVRDSGPTSPSASPQPEPEVGESADYAVGYGRPPAHTQFKPGTSGNPSGRPPGARGIKTLVRDMMTAKVSVRTATGVTQVTRIEVLLHKVLELALKGNPRALSIILTLYDGAVPEPPLPPSGTEEETDEVVLMLQEKAHQFLTRAVAEE